MLLDCHVHTSEHSPCSVMTAYKACATASAAGLDAMALTDHHYLAGQAEIDALMRHFPGLRLYPGIEVTVAEGFDMVVLTPRGASPATEFRPRPFLGLDELERQLRPMRDDCFLFVAHPFRYQDRRTADLESVLAFADGVEVNSINILKTKPTWNNGQAQPANAELYEQAARDFDLVRLTNTDAHQENALGCLANSLPGQPPAEPAELNHLLRTTPPQPHQNPERLKKILGKSGFLSLFGL
ncbi:PHP domain-containing protein [Desulfohalovibrio reitneri]|uniref:PHP domain-containing protein n=1 Tax=Desulfohalovibrio reitneri TaxID=1307759 RepID=UPI00068FB940|nr:PHP domain-containing protein [Desulfohalovibrio reitneri]